MTQNQKPKPRKRPRNLRLSDNEVVERAYRGGGWNAYAKERYVARIKIMDAKSLGAEIREVKAVLADKSSVDMEHKTVAKKTKAAYKLSAIMVFLESLL